MGGKAYNIAIIGATGAVGEEMLKCLETSRIAIKELTLLASARSAGKQLEFAGKSIEVQDLAKADFSEIDIALLSAGGELSKRIAPEIAKAGALVIDNSSAFRLDDEVPLIIPEINGEMVAQATKGIIANPNCTTIISLMALWPLHQRFGLKSIIASSYQAVSGSGTKGIKELSNQLKSWLEGKPLEKEVYPHQIAFNTIPQVDVFDELDYTKEEWKIAREGRKIMGLPDLKVTCTCVRIPVMRSHSVSISAGFEKLISANLAKEVYSQAKGVSLVDDPSIDLYPVALDASHRDDCFVGRIREDQVLPNAIALWVVGDQVRKGAALNAVQIAETWATKHHA